MRFFFLQEEPAALQGEWQPPTDLDQHLRALRFHPGAELLLMLPRGGALKAIYAAPGRLLLQGLTELPRLPLMPITLATAWPKGGRADDLMTRAAEAGVERILPLACARSVVGREEFSPQRWLRWERILRETCQQARRPILPMLERAAVPVAEVLKEAPLAHPIALMPGAWPLQHELDLRQPREVLLIVGPEGGFSPEEEEWLRSAGVGTAGLLPTILRIESAGPIAAAICQHDFLARSAF
jgi:16S rRNA (uracil1498-N3)-methyltransferase